VKWRWGFKKEEAVVGVVGKEVKVAGKDAAFVRFALGEWRSGNCVLFNEQGAMQAVSFLLLGFGGGVCSKEFACPIGTKQVKGELNEIPLW
jgi:hypothetical protein